MTEPSDSFPAIYVELKALRLLLDERDRRYHERFAAAQEMVQTAFASAEKAIVKAEHAQTIYNQTHNDLQRQMAQKEILFAQKPEVDREFNRVAERLDDGRRALGDYQQAQALEIRSLRESRAGYGGIWQAVVAAALLAGFIGAAVGLLGHVVVR